MNIKQRGKARSMGIRQELISFAHELESQSNEAFSLWTSLPSRKAAEAGHGDYADNFTPPVSDILKEACCFMADGMVANMASEHAYIYQCPCGEDHSSPVESE